MYVITRQTVFERANKLEFKRVWMCLEERIPKCYPADMPPPAAIFNFIQIRLPTFAPVKHFSVQMVRCSYTQICMKNKGLLLLLGYLLFSLGVTSMVMELVGTHWYFLGWLEHAGRLTAFLLKILMLIGGILIIVFAQTDWKQEKLDSMKDDEEV